MEQRAVESAARVREETEQAAAQSTTQLREEMNAAAQSAARLKEDMDRALAEERERALNDLNTERARLQEEMSAERNRLAAEIEAERLKAQMLNTVLEETRLALTDAEAELGTARGVQEQLRATLTEERETTRTAAASQQQPDQDDAITRALVAERQSQIAFVERLLSAVRAIGASRSLSDTLTSLTTAAASIAPRAALFVVRSRQASASCKGGARQASATLAGLAASDADGGGVLAAAAAQARPCRRRRAAAPAFAALAKDRAAIGVPIMVGGHSVAVLYADDAAARGARGAGVVARSHADSRRHASACLRRSPRCGRRRRCGRPAVSARASNRCPPPTKTAARGGMRGCWSPRSSCTTRPPCELGREKRDLLHPARSRDRSRPPPLRRARVSVHRRARRRTSSEELVHTLADGDAALLGESA